jgi:hypothetical protein
MTRLPIVRQRALLALIAAVVTLGIGWSDPSPAIPAASRLGLPVAAGSALAGRTSVAPRAASLASADTGGAASPSFSLHVRQAPQVRIEAPQKPAAKPTPKPVVHAAPKPQAPVYSGRNHFWFPAIGMSYRVYDFPCSRSREPDNLVYRWGCAGRNNVYLLGHAYGVFKALHDAYVRGKLRKGMVAIYADSTGHVRKYKVVSWRVVDPSDSAWAIADQAVPSMTLQTCVGPNSSLRLNVRLVAID